MKEISQFYFSFCLRSQLQSYDRQTICLKKVLIIIYVVCIMVRDRDVQISGYSKLISATTPELSLSPLVCLYCYWRHNAYCEPGLYSVFSLAEYLVVLTNILLHSTAARDFNKEQLHIRIPALIFSDESK